MPTLPICNAGAISWQGARAYHPHQAWLRRARASAGSAVSAACWAARFAGVAGIAIGAGHEIPSRQRVCRVCRRRLLRLRAAARAPRRRLAQRRPQRLDRRLLRRRHAARRTAALPGQLAAGGAGRASLRPHRLSARAPHADRSGAAAGGFAGEPRRPRRTVAARLRPGQAVAHFQNHAAGATANLNPDHQRAAVSPAVARVKAQPYDMHRLKLITLTLLAALGGAAGAQPITLQQAIASALEHNPDLRLSQLGVEGAAAQQTIAGAAPNPTLTLQSFNINANAGVGAGGLRSKTVDSSVRVDQLIERGGKRELRVENAAKLAAASGSDLRETRRQVRLLVSQAYYDLLAADGKLAITRESAQLFDRTVEAARKRQHAGDLAPADVARAQVDALRARNDVLQAESDLFVARQTLALLIGEPANAAQLTALDAWPDVPAAVTDNVASDAVNASAVNTGASSIGVADVASGVNVGRATAGILNDGDADGMLSRRPDVLAAQARFDAAQAARKLALAARSADVTVGLQFEHYPTSITNTQGSGNSFGIALQIPLFVRYGYDGEIRAADVALDTARENMHQARVQARSELELSEERVRSAADKLRRYEGSGGDSIIGAAKKSADAAEFAFQRGALAIMDLLDVRRTYRAAQLEALAACADYAKSLAALQAATSEGK